MKYFPIPAPCLAPLAALILCSCASSPVTTGNVKDFMPHGTLGKTTPSAKPAITFPAKIAFVYVQFSDGAIAARLKLETNEECDKISKLPGVAGTVSLNDILPPDSAISYASLRAIARKQNAGVIVIYSVNSESPPMMFRPLSLLTLCVVPNDAYKIFAGSSAIVMDAKTGFVYGSLSTQDEFSKSGSDPAKIDAACRRAEQAEFKKLIGGFEPFWKQVYARYEH